MPRGPRLDMKGALHHVMVRGLEGRAIFLSDRDRGDLVKRLSDIGTKTGTVIYAWSLLSNHFHLLLRTGREPLSRVMRRILTGYAVSFNRRHKRIGHLFQNRYKSILVEEEPYFLQLVRYIHLNPLRVGLLKELPELESWPWSGHATLMGKREYDWQNIDFVLSQFAGRMGEARRRYREFVLAGVSEGHRQDLTGGGLVRSLGGRGASPGLAGRGREQWAFDERVLGSSDFVEEVLEEVGGRRSQEGTTREEKKAALDGLISKVAIQLGLSQEELTGGSRRRDVVLGRYLIGYIAVRQQGYPVIDIAKKLRVSGQSVLRALERGPRLLKDLGWEEGLND
jgi:REP-associated tyrosine transposase